MIAGANVNVSTDGTIELYGRSWPVIAQLANTGTSLDNSVFISQNTVPDMVAASAKGLQAGHVRRICRQSRLHRDD